MDSEEIKFDKDETSPGWMDDDADFAPALKLSHGESTEFEFQDNGKLWINKKEGKEYFIFSVKIIKHPQVSAGELRGWFMNKKLFELKKSLKVIAGESKTLVGKKAELHREGKGRFDTKWTIKALGGN